MLNPLFDMSSVRELTGTANGEDLLRMRASTIGVPARCGVPAAQALWEEASRTYPDRLGLGWG